MQNSFYLKDQKNQIKDVWAEIVGDRVKPCFPRKPCRKHFHFPCHFLILFFKQSEKLSWRNVTLFQRFPYWNRYLIILVQGLQNKVGLVRKNIPVNWNKTPLNTISGDKFHLFVGGNQRNKTGTAFPVHFLQRQCCSV